MDRPRNDTTTYWDRHAGPSNLPGGGRLTARSWPEEIAFYLTPEQEYAYDVLGPLANALVLEIGCGVGVNALRMAGEGATVLALDASYERLKTLRAVAGELGVAGAVFPVCATAENLPFRADSLDAAYSKSSLIHTDLSAALAQCRQALKDGGRGVFCEPTTLNPFAFLYRRFFAPAEWRGITRYFSRREEETLEASFGNLAMRSFYLTGFLAFYWQFGRRNLPRFQRWLRVLHALDSALFRILPPLRRLAWFRVYVVEKRPAGEASP